MRSQDEEHRRIARNLHDSLGQYLTIIKMNLESMNASNPENKDLSSALEWLGRSISETRTLSFLLHPPLLDEVGFTSAARWFTDEFAKRSGIEVKLDLPAGVDRLPELAEIALFRILQESLTNVHRHSGSSAVEVHLKVGEAQAVFTVRDFGRGMPTKSQSLSQPSIPQLGVGLSGMKERVTDLGGNFEIQSGTDGTAITVSLPLTPTSDDRNGNKKTWLHKPPGATPPL
jgi:signal transduction histidine kinase